MIRDRLTKKAYPIQLPVGSGELFTGHIDVLRRVEVIFDEETLGKTFTEMPVPEAYQRAGRGGAPRGDRGGGGARRASCWRSTWAARS